VSFVYRNRGRISDVRTNAGAIGGSLAWKIEDEIARYTHVRPESLNVKTISLYPFAINLDWERGREGKEERGTNMNHGGICDSSRGRENRESRRLRDFGTRIIAKDSRPLG